MEKSDMDRRKRGRREAEGEGADSESTSLDEGSLRKSETGALGSAATADFSSESAAGDDSFHGRLKKKASEVRKPRSKIGSPTVDVGEGGKPRSARPSGGKDRHSKVQTSKGLRDRRVRLSVATAIQFYDVQDRLGYDQPSKAVEWLLKKAKAAIDELPPVPLPAAVAAPSAFSPQLSIKSGQQQLSVPRFYPQAMGLSPSSSFKEPEREEEQHVQQPSSVLEASSKGETGKGQASLVAKLEARVRARERAKERMKEKATGRELPSPSHSPDQQQPFATASAQRSTPQLSFDSSTLNVPDTSSFTSLLQTPHVPFQNLVQSLPPTPPLYHSQFVTPQLGFQQALLQAASLEPIAARQFYPPFPPSFGPAPDFSFYSGPAPPLTAAGILSSNPLLSDPFMSSTPHQASSHFRPALFEEASYLQGLLGRPHHSSPYSNMPSALQSETFPASQAHHFASPSDRNVPGFGARGVVPSLYFSSSQQFPGIVQGLGDVDELGEMKDARSSSPPPPPPPPRPP